MNGEMEDELSGPQELCNVHDEHDWGKRVPDVTREGGSREFDQKSGLALLHTCR